MTAAVETAVPLAVRNRAGYWLVALENDQPTWGEHEDALRFDSAREAWQAVATFQPDLWAHEGANVRAWDVTEGCRAVVEPCTACGATGREAEDNPYFLKQGFAERCCLCCWGHGKRAIVALSTVQLFTGALLGAKPHDSVIHLVRCALAGGSPGPLLCGIDFRARGGPGYNVGGGCSGTGWTNTPCAACVTAAREAFPGLPVFGSVGGREIAEALGVALGSTCDFDRPVARGILPALRALRAEASMKT
jgi:hypothetical protein